MNYLKSDNVVLDDRPRYVGEIVKARQEAPQVIEPLPQQPTPQRRGSDQHLSIPSRGFGC